MGKKPKALRRGLFGIRSGDVEQLLSDRDATATAAAEQVRASEERANESEARVAALEAQLADLSRAQAEEAREDTDPLDPQQLLQAVREEMARVMHATQQAGSRLIEHARMDMEQQLEVSERRRQEIESERDQLTSWIADLHQSSGALRETIVEAAGTLRHTMRSMDEAGRAVARIVGRMADADAVINRLQETGAIAPAPEA